MNHTCHAIDCYTEVKPELLMCLKHWRMVPRKLQSAVWATYRRGQCDDHSMVTEEYLLAAANAIDAVAVKEGKPATRANAITQLQLRIDQVKEEA